MNDQIITEIANDLGVKKHQVEVVLTLLSEGNTIPFIARYRKEATGALDEEEIRKINEVYEYQVNLLKRKEDVIRLIDEKGLLTEELKNEILNASKLVEVEDLYRPYKEKKKTKATEAIKNGLEPLADIFMKFPDFGTLDSICQNFLTEQVKTVADAVQGAKYIIAERISDDAKYRKAIRDYVYHNGVLISKKKKNAEDEKGVYEMYYDYSEKVSRMKPHRVLAVNRGEKEGVLSVSLDVNQEDITSYLERKIIKNPKSFVVDEIKDAIKDSLKRLIYPSVEREVRADLKEVGEEDAIQNFSHNVEHLLLTPPMKEKVVMGFDPAFRTGCKLAVLDGTGKVLDIAVIYPTEPHNDFEGSKKVLLDLIDRYQVDVIAIGNGTASRESEAFVAACIKEAKRKVEYIIVSEAGASVYSASPLAISEFPDLTVEKRSAISIGRRLQDALSELVKIDPKSIGVGLYQHDVQQKKLDESLDFVVTKTVNRVGVNINTASSSLLKYVSGLTKKAIDAILAYRDQFGKFLNRDEVKKVKGITPKVYEQAIGFLRIEGGDHPLDRTSIHPDNYKQAESILKELGFSANDIGTDALKNALKDFDYNSYMEKLGIDRYTLEDIIKAFLEPNRDPRDDMPKPLLRADILHLEDLHVGEKLQGTVRNVVDFGAFIDVGLHDDGLVHISKISKSYIKHPSDILSVGDIVDCYVIGIDLKKQKLSLSLIPEA
ncbi:MAG TPA: RNA-binding transcriptional accessory protein [Candidatus Faecenecus gallistercoris]|uniref:RNA-binding transcriptional accessory protein n=1 Tax=Candidatus Faecenecus gallistercoris TaxID=2840793 RepID=A0A9D0YZY8_9FIRM|nr:RNA-binding transcriptional accessory protein [Candidatus Faecenecus gallistercoris]